MLESVLTGTIIGIIIVISMALGAKKIAYSILENSKNTLKKELEDWLNTEKGKIALYMVGTMIGNGLKTGVGFGGKGKRKWEDLAMEGISQFLKGGFKFPSGENKSTTDLATKKPDDWKPKF